MLLLRVFPHLTYHILLYMYIYHSETLHYDTYLCLPPLLPLEV